MTAHPVHICIKSHPKNLCAIREKISDTIADVCLSEELTGSIILAIDEVCSNIIRHGYANDYTQNIHIRVEPSAEDLTITIEDSGVAFDIKDRTPRDIAEIKPGGLGLHIITSVMDCLEYSRTDNGMNQIKMVKKLS